MLGWSVMGRVLIEVDREVLGVVSFLWGWGFCERDVVGWGGEEDIVGLGRWR